jgi:recombination protein RecA
MGIISKSGSFYSFGDTRLGQGREAAKEYLKEHDDLASVIIDKIRGTPKSDAKLDGKGDDGKSEK